MADAVGLHRKDVLAGAAWVEISTDSGATWNPADIVRTRSGYSWDRWEHDWKPAGPGCYTVMSRATNNLGEVQPVEFPGKWDGRGYGNNMIFPFEVVVS